MGMELFVPENRYIPPYYRGVLKNGLEIYGIPINRGSGVIYSSLWIRAGSRNETLGKTGIAHMLEHMSFKSSTHLKEGEFDQIVRSFGGVTNAATSFDYTFYYIKIATPYLGITFRLFREMLKELLLREDEFQRERQVVYEERLWRVDNNPGGYLFFRLFNNSYIYHPYHWTPIGFKQDILNWTIEDIREFYRTFYSPNNSFLLVAGDIDPETLYREGEKWFGDLEPQPIPKIHQKEPPLDGEKWVEIRRDTKAEKVVIGFPIPRFDSPDIVRLEILGELWCRGRSGRLIEELFYKRKLVSNIYSYPMDLRDGGLFIIGATCNEGVDPKQVVEEI
ncbi:MAG: pitrilysin family protein, partial [Campylobacterales bacterium]